eukprot:scaffold137111_cov14-Tisochrysis_lutea.AAC.1
MQYRGRGISRSSLGLQTPISTFRKKRHVGFETSRAPFTSNIAMTKVWCCSGCATFLARQDASRNKENYLGCEGLLAQTSQRNFSNAWTALETKARAVCSCHCFWSQSACASNPGMFSSACVAS